MGRSRVISALTGLPSSSLARGEIWVAPAVLESQGLPNSAAGVAGLAAQLGSDLCFLSCTGPQAVPMHSETMREAVSFVHERDLACGAVVDGPWQRLAERDGLFPTIAKVGTHIDETERGLSSMASLAGEELSAWCNAGVDLVLLADDIAFNQGPYFSPTLFERLLSLHYLHLVRLASERGVPVGFHSDGNLTLLMPVLMGAGFSLYSLEPEAMELSEVRHRFGDKFTLIAGIRASWLDVSGEFGSGEIDLRREISSLASLGRIILGSSCGVYEPSSVARLADVYRVADGLAGGDG